MSQKVEQTIDTISLKTPPKEETLVTELKRALLEEKEAIALGLAPQVNFVLNFTVISPLRLPE